jgi:host factor-I protein
MKNIKEENSLQDIVLKRLQKDKEQVVLFLINGVKLQGVITFFDGIALLLKRDGHSQLVYKHGISTIMPLDPVQFSEIVE